MYGSNEDHWPEDNDADRHDREQFKIEKSEIYDEPESLPGVITAKDINSYGFECCVKKLIAGENSELFTDFKHAIMTSNIDSDYINTLAVGMRDELVNSYNKYYADNTIRFRVY